MEDDEFEIEIETDEDDEEIVSKKLMHPLHLQRRIAILVVIEDFRYNGADDKFLSDAADLYMSDLAKDEVELLKKESEAPGMRNYVDALVSPDSKLWPYRKPLLSLE